MSEIEDMDDYEEQIEQMIAENGMLLHSLVNILVRKGVVTQEELDTEMDELFAAMEEDEDEDNA